MYVDPQNMSALDSKDFVAVALHFAILEIVDEEGLTTNLDGIGPIHAYANGKYLFAYIRKPIDTNGNFATTSSLKTREWNVSSKLFSTIH